MKVFRYIKETALFVLCVVLIVFVTDLVLLTSSSIGAVMGDIIYLNIVLAIVILAVWTYGYLKFRARYSRIREALDKKENIQYLLPKGKGFFETLLREAVNSWNDEWEQKLHGYQSSMDELNDYITKWVHEIKIPISVCELVLENMNSDSTENVRKLKVELERTRFLINQVLYAARTAHYSEDLTINEFNMGKAVKEAVKRNAYSFILKNIEISLGVLDFCIVNDEKWVSYILEQILNNAAKYTEKDGMVEIWTSEDDKSIRLHIKDNGIGIPSGDLNRVFEKGFTGNNGRRTTKSTGMGMYFSRKMADRLGIGLEVYSRVDEYTEFVMVFYKMRDYYKVT